MQRFPIQGIKGAAELSGERQASACQEERPVVDFFLVDTRETKVQEEKLRATDRFHILFNIVLARLAREMVQMRSISRLAKANASQNLAILVGIGCRAKRPYGA